MTVLFAIPPSDIVLIGGAAAASVHFSNQKHMLMLVQCLHVRTTQSD